ncbi:MAG: CYTH domain-containing protein [Clostridia bacterium]|nr:CYTH domain-containing protein [Clostridia bacterium]
MEIERKFLVKEIPCLDGCEKSEIVQGYISLTPETRIRKRDNQYYLTVKGEGDVVREETEKLVSEKEGKELFSKVESALIEKTRYLINIGSYIAELDIYKNRLQGLIVVEVEFETEADANSFVPPDWFGEDISKNKEYRNKVLAYKS